MEEEEQEKAQESKKGFFGRSMEKANPITIDEALRILGARLKWCNSKIDFWEDDPKDLKYLDNLTKLAGPLMQAYRRRGIEVDEDQDLT